MQYEIPFNRFSFAGNELQYIADAVHKGHISGDGAFTERCSYLLEQRIGVPKALLTTSCTHALEMCALLLDIAPGDEVIVPSFTFTSTINAFVLRGATPKFADIRPDTLNLDESKIEALISPRTKAIVVVHYAGVACDMDAIGKIAAQRRVAIVEDNAHGLFATYRGRNLGTFGCLATQSFHETKNFTCGEGGALLINDPNLIERAEIVREKGTNRSRFFRGLVDKYSWVNIGSSFLPSDILAAFLYAQLEAATEIQTKRAGIWSYYNCNLRDWAKESGALLPFVPDHCEQPFHMFYVLMPNLTSRQRLMAHLKARGILAVFHYLPLHLSDMGRRLGAKPGDCPVTEEMSDRLLRLPFFTELTEAQQDRVVESIYAFSGLKAASAGKKH